MAPTFTDWGVRRAPTWQALADEARARVETSSRDHPYLSLVAAAGVGVIVGRTIPLRALVGAARWWRMGPFA